MKDWLDPSVGRAALKTALDRVRDGARRIVVWGPSGVGKRTLLRRLEEAVEALTVEAITVEAITVEASDLEEAARALAEASPTGSTVVATISRRGLEADAFIECRPLSVGKDEALDFLLRLLARDGLEPPSTDRAALQAIAVHSGGLPGVLRRAADQLRVLSPADLQSRAERAHYKLTVFGEPVDHPLYPAPSLPPLSTELQLAALALVAAGEPIEPSLAEELVGTTNIGAALDAIVALRDAGVVRRHRDGRLSVPIASAFALVARLRTRLGTFSDAATHLDEAVVARANHSLKRWWTHGSSDALEAISRDEGFLRRAAERALPRAREDSDAARRLATIVLALRAWGEVVAGATAERDLLERALSTVVQAMPRTALRLDYARLLRLAGDFEGLGRELDAHAVDQLTPENAERWHAERAHFLRQVRQVDEAFAHTERAIALAEKVGFRHRAARHVIDVGTMHFWSERIDQALEFFERGRARAAQLGAHRTEAIALTNLCLALGLAGDEVSARARGEEASERFRQLEDRGALGATLGHLAILALQHNRLEAATAHFEEAEALLTESHYVEQIRFVRFNWAECLLASGKLADAEALACTLDAMLAEHPDALVSVALEWLRADLFEEQERLAEALSALEQGMRRARESEYAEGIVQLGARQARIYAKRGDAASSEAAMDEVERMLSASLRPEVRASAGIAMDHARTRLGVRELRRLEEALRPSFHGLAVRSQPGISVADSLAVRQTAEKFFRDLPHEIQLEVERRVRDPKDTSLVVDGARQRAYVPGGAELRADGRRNAYWLLERLGRAGASGRTREALIADLWPDERMLKSAALNRLHNALAQLRAAGLEPFLSRTAEGYRFEKTLPVIFLGEVDPFAPRTD
ncbi:MAG: hypothetical protein AAGF12_06890 [Myxococcota bacterium]